MRKTAARKPIKAPKSKGAILAQPEVSVAIIDEATLQDKICTIRGQQVMLDFDLAEIYGYTTKAFNQQVKNNIEKFEEDFMLELEETETYNIRSNFLTGSHRNERYRIKVFTEQGIYMLMTVLRGPLAVQQSKTLIRLFKAMKDHLVRQHNPDLEGLVAFLNHMHMLARLNTNSQCVFMYMPI